MTEFDGSELVHWRELPPTERRGWWEHVWDGAIMLSARYRLALRKGWWEDCVQVEAVAAFHAWLRLYDTGAYTDPPGKLQLLWELERLRSALRAGDTAFDPAADRRAFDLYVRTLETDSSPARGGDAASRSALAASHMAAELSAISQRVSELRTREHLLEDEAATGRRRSGEEHQLAQELQRVRAAISELDLREHTLRARVNEEGRSAPPC